VNGGIELVSSGGTASGATVNSGGTLELFGNAVADLFGTTVINSGGILELGSGYTLSGYGIGNGVTVEVASSGTFSGGFVSSGGRLVVLSGGLADPNIVS